MREHPAPSLCAAITTLLPSMQARCMRAKEHSMSGQLHACAERGPCWSAGGVENFTFPQGPTTVERGGKPNDLFAAKEAGTSQRDSCGGLLYEPRTQHDLRSNSSDHPVHFQYRQSFVNLFHWRATSGTSPPSTPDHLSLFHPPD